MISASLVLLWILRLPLPRCAPGAECREVAEAISEAANADRDPVAAAALLTSVAWHESHFSLYAASRGDDLGFGLFQLSREWTLFPVSPELQAHMALWLIRDSLDRCGDLTEYGSGQCGVARDEMQERSELACELEDALYIEPEAPRLMKRTNAGRTRR